MSVVPLAALTLYAYTSNAKALREAAGRETELLASELSQRMQVVTARLTERVEHLMDLAAAETKNSTPSEPAVEKVAAMRPVEPAADETQVADALGQLAMLLNNVELRDPFGRGRGGGGGGGGGGRGDGRRGGLFGG